MSIGSFVYVLSISLILYLYIAKTRSILYSLIYAFIHIYISTVLFANVLSIFNLYTKFYVILFWENTMCVVLTLCMVWKIKPTLLRDVLVHRINRMRTCEKLILCAKVYRQAEGRIWFGTRIKVIKGGKAISTPWNRLIAVKLIHAPVTSLVAHFHIIDTTPSSGWKDPCRNQRGILMKFFYTNYLAKSKFFLIIIV